MASENVKIVIKELNETEPKGAGESSDIVYVPGLAIDTAISETELDNGTVEYTYAVKNTPMLCKTVDEFELYFGATPYQLTAEDISSSKNEAIGYVDGDVDLSYIYAKELLKAGLTVYYENIVDDTDYAAISDEFTAAQEALGTAETAANTAITNFETAEDNIDGVATDDPTYEDLKRQYDEADAAKTAAVSALEVAQAEYDNAKAAYDAAFGEDGQGGTKAMSKIDYLYFVLADRLTVLEDLGEYSIKYITSGGYPTFTNYAKPENNALAAALINLAATRGDAVALIDHGNDSALTLDPKDKRSIYYAVNQYNWTNGTYGAMFTPWAKYSCVTLKDNPQTEDANEALKIMPASFGYLKCLASAVKTSPNWLAMAGVTRGIVPHIQGLNTKNTLSNVIAEEYQPKFGSEGNKISVNAITNIKPYGLTLWGNRTLEAVNKKGTTALNFLNTRNMISDIKKLSHSTAQSLMFEQDSDALWNRFKSKISPLLDQLKTGYGISNYKILRATTKINGDPLTRGELAAVIRIYPLYAIEYFDITVVISEEE